MIGSIAPRRKTGAARPRGFTLLELMIVVAVVAILTATAISAYDFATVKARRKMATGCLLENAQMMQRFKTVGNGTTALTYVGAPSVSTSGCAVNLNRDYTFAVNPAATVNTFTIVATPIPNSRQAKKDTLCGWLSVDQIGTKLEGGTGTPADCW